MSGGKRKFKDTASAMAMRDLITKIAEGAINRLRPDDFVAEVYSYNHFTRKATVKTAGMGEDEPAIEVNYAPAMGVRSRHSDTNTGTIVLVGGIPGNYWIKKILNGAWTTTSGRMINSRFYGGAYYHLERESQYVIEVDLPATGNTMSVGYFYNTGLTDWSGGFATLKLKVNQELFVAMIKEYDVLLPNHTEGGVWKTLAPDKDSGASFGNDFAVEIKFVLNSGFYLRIRRLRAGVYSQGGYTCDIRLFGREFTIDTTQSNIEEFDARPTEYFGRNDVAIDELQASEVNTGPFSTGIKHEIEVRAQANLIQPTDFGWNGTYLKWTGNWKALGLGVNDLSSLGYLAFPMPAVGVAIPVHGWSGGYSLNVDANGIPISAVGNGAALYVEPLFFTNGAAGTARYHLVGDDTPFKIPSHWILLAVMNTDQTIGNSMKLGDGTTIDHWRYPAMQSGFTSSGVTRLGVKLVGNKVTMMGRAVKTTGWLASTTYDVATLPSSVFYPPTNLVYAIGVVGGLARSTIQSTGSIQVNTSGAIGAGDPAYLDGISYDVEPRA